MKVTSCLIKTHVMKPYVEVEVYFHAFLTSALDGSQCSASVPTALLPVKGPRYPWIGG